MNLFLKSSLAATFTALALAAGTQGLGNGNDIRMPPLPRDPKDITAREKWEACRALNNGIFHSRIAVKDDNAYLDNVLVLHGTLCLSPNS